jgi:6-phosphogluconolactonase
MDDPAAAAYTGRRQRAAALPTPDLTRTPEAKMTSQLPMSRRDFVSAASLGMAGLVTGAAGPAWSQQERSGDLLLYAGTYTEAGRRRGIFLLRMDPRTGALRQVGAVDAGANTSFVAIHPTGRVLYAVNEVGERAGSVSGAVSAFAIAGDSGRLTRLGDQSSEGGAPCYVSVDRGGRVVLVANYASGTVAVLPIDASGALGHATQVIQHRGSGPNAARQEGPHAHCILAHPSNRFALAADLGMDRVLLYRLDVEDRSLHHVDGGDAVMRPGTGPRHLAFHPSLPLVFVVGELDSTVTALHCDAESGAMSTLQTLSTLPAGWTGANFPADIHVAPSGRTLYVSNRGHDSIAVLSVAPATGALALEQVVSTGGHWPRNFSLDPTGRWLLVANERSSSIVVFERDLESGRLTSTDQRIAVPSPVCLRFAADRGVAT